MHLHARCCAAQRGLTAKIQAPHEGKFFLDMIKHPVVVVLLWIVSFYQL
jgi:hypothetical protein